jgi:hypothetical protein
MDTSTPPQFSNVRTDGIDDHHWCGQVTGKDAFGAPLDHQRFAVFVSASSHPYIEFDSPDNRDYIDKECGGAPSHVSEWVSVSKSENGSEERADLASIRVDGTVRHALIKSVYAPHSVLNDKDPSTWWTSSEGQKSFDCKEGTARRESLTIYFSDGTDASRPEKAFPTMWELIRPDTTLNEVKNFICAWKAS